MSLLEAMEKLARSGDRARDVLVSDFHFTEKEADEILAGTYSGRISGRIVEDLEPARSG